jgi:DNA polymerase-3 subunit alpha
MAKKYQYSCGCSFGLNDKNGLIFNPDINSINLDCSRTWNLISDGNTKGCFQLESRLGRSIAKKLKPENIEQLSALIAVLRPGSLEAIRDGKSVTNHYIDKKNGQETLDNFHPSLEPILNSTYGEMIYQEQAMEIAKVVAGFNLLEADMLRKAIGKKKPEEMAKVKSKFLEGSSSLGIITDNEAEQIFGWIEKSQRYSFNKSILEETVVVTESGEKTIKDLNIGEKILSPVISDDNVYKNEYVEVINKYDHGEQEVFKITLDNGNHITCTMEHKFLCSDNEVHPLSEILLNNLEIMCIT